MAAFKDFERSKTETRRWWIGTLTVLVVIVLLLIHDIIITNFLAYKICRSDPQPKTFIKKTIEFPESIYWEDNIYPGFDEKDRLLMIRNYLDGVHLKTMALNAPNGKIYVYNATEDDWWDSRMIKAGKKEGDYFETLEKESKRIAERGQIFLSQAMPQFNYSVTFSSVFLTSFQRRYLWSDEVTIVDKRTNEVIAYKRRLMRRWYMTFPDFELGNRYYSSSIKCGTGGSFYNFDRKVFFKLRPKESSFHGMNINYFLYDKFIRGVM